MNFISKIKNRIRFLIFSRDSGEVLTDSIPSDSKFKVILITRRKLSDEKKKQVFNLVKDGITFDNLYSDICIQIAKELDIDYIDSLAIIKLIKESPSNYKITIL